MIVAELVYFAGCPNVDEARNQLQRALAAVQLDPRWVEYEATDPALPEHAKGFGSPTILINGREVTGATPGGTSDACRLYLDDQGRRALAPALSGIVAALTAAQAAGR